MVIQGAGAGNDTTAAGVLAGIIDLQDLFPSQFLDGCLFVLVVIPFRWEEVQVVFVSIGLYEDLDHLLWLLILAK